MTRPAPITPREERKEEDMQSITINLAIEDFVNLDYLEENVIREIAKDAESKLTGGHTESFHKLCVDAINEAINSRIQARIEELLSRPIPPLDRFGDPIEGEPKTLSDMLAEAVDKCLTDTVDSAGKPEKRTAYNNARPRLEWLVKKVAAEKIAIEAEKAARQVNKEAKDHAQKVLANAVATGENGQMTRLIQTDESLERLSQRPETQRRQRLRGNCPTCEKAKRNGHPFHPPHDPSPNCKSGKRPHCTCDACF